MSTIKLVKEIFVGVGIHLVLFIVITSLLIANVGPIYDELQTYSQSVEVLTLQLQQANIDPEDPEDLARLTQILEDTDGLRSAERRFYGFIFLLLLVFSLIIALVLPITYMYLNKEYSWKRWRRFFLRFLGVSVGLVLLSGIYFFIMSIVIARLGLSDSAASGWIVSVIFFVLFIVGLIAFYFVSRDLFKKPLPTKKAIQIHSIFVMSIIIVAILSSSIIGAVGLYFQRVQTLGAFFSFTLVMLIIFSLFSAILTLEKRYLLTGNLFK